MDGTGRSSPLPPSSQVVPQEATMTTLTFTAWLALGFTFAYWARQPVRRQPLAVLTQLWSALLNSSKQWLAVLHRYGTSCPANIQRYPRHADVRSRASRLAGAGPLAALPVHRIQPQRIFRMFCGAPGGTRPAPWAIGSEAGLPVNKDKDERPMSTEINMVKKAVHDKIESQIDTAQARLETLKAKAEAANANAELKLIAELLTKKRAIDQKLDELKESGDSAYQRAKTDVESRIAELEKSVQAIEARFKAAQTAGEVWS
jgi:hypothetical protein